MAAPLEGNDFDRVPKPLCAECGHILELAVHTGPRGLFVSSICHECCFVRTPYTGPGAEQAIREHVLGERWRR